VSIAIAIDDRRRCREADVGSSHDEVLLRSSQVEGTLSTESVNEVSLSKSSKRQALGSVKMQVVDTRDQQKGRQTERAERGNKVGIMTSTVRERESRINLNPGRSPRGKAKDRKQTDPGHAASPMSAAKERYDDSSEPCVRQV